MFFSFPLVPLTAGDHISPIPFVLGGIGLAAVIIMVVLAVLEQRKKQRQNPPDLPQPPASSDTHPDQDA